MGLKIGKKSFKKGNHKPAEVCKDIFAEKRRENPKKRKLCENKAIRKKHSAEISRGAPPRTLRSRKEDSG